MPSIGKSGVVGVADLHKTIDQLAKDLTVNGLRKGLRAGVALLRDDARRRVKVRTGALKKAISSDTKLVKRDGKGRPSQYLGRVIIARKAYTVTARGKAKLAKKAEGQKRAFATGQVYPRAYGHLVEFGTQAHQDGPRKHPGAQPEPFLRPAWDAKKGEAQELVRRTLQEEAAKSAARRARR